jgi:hypothetical protein
VFGCEEGRGEIRVQNMGPVTGLHFWNVGDITDNPGIVEPDIKTAERVFGCLNQLFCILLVANITCNREGRAAASLDFL